MAGTTAISYLLTIAIAAGIVTESAATYKLIKYNALSQRYAYVQITTVSHRTFGKSALDFIYELGLRATTVTLDSRETSFFF